MMVSGARLDKPRQLEAVQTIPRNLRAEIIEQQEMAGGKLGLARLERTVITGIEARTAKIIVVLGRKAGGNLLGATAMPSPQIGVAALRTHRGRSAFR